MKYRWRHVYTASPRKYADYVDVTLHDDINAACCEVAKLNGMTCKDPLTDYWIVEEVT